MLGETLLLDARVGDVRQALDGAAGGHGVRFEADDGVGKRGELLQEKTVAAPDVEHAGAGLLGDDAQQPRVVGGVVIPVGGHAGSAARYLVSRRHGLLKGTQTAEADD